MKRFLPLLVLLVSCNTVPPTVIGADTRQEIKHANQAIVVVQNEAVQIDEKVKEISRDVEVLKSKAPIELQEDVKAIGEKVKTLSILTGSHADKTVPEARKALDKAEESFEKDMQKTSAISQELDTSKEKLASTKSQRNTLAMIILMLSAIAVVMLLVRRFIPKLPLS